MGEQSLWGLTDSESAEQSVALGFFVLGLEKLKPQCCQLGDALSNTDHPQPCIFHLLNQTDSSLSIFKKDFFPLTYFLYLSVTWNLMENLVHANSTSCNETSDFIVSAWLVQGLCERNDYPRRQRAKPPRQLQPTTVFPEERLLFKY